MSNVFVLDHPLVKNHISILRNQKTLPQQFRSSLHRLATILAWEATRDLVVREIEIQTPMTKAIGHQLALSIALVPILRAGLGMIEPVLDLLPEATVCHLGVARNEDTAEPIKYYSRIPHSMSADVGLVLDPMLATSGSSILALNALHESGVKTMKLLSIIAARDGIDAVQNRFPNSQIFVCAIDSELNARKFIVPGLGDAGDRIFNTPQST